MSKSILIGGRLDEIHPKETSLDLGDDFFTRLHSEVKKQNEKYPLLWNLVKDFYEDVFYSVADTKNLVLEINRFLSGTPKITKDHIIWLNVLGTLCTEAIEKEMTLFCIAD